MQDKVKELFSKEDWKLITFYAKQQNISPEQLVKNITLNFVRHKA